MNIQAHSFRTAAVAVALSAIVAGCATPYPPYRYYRGEAQRTQSIELGVIEGIRPVGLEGPTSGAGALGGAALGGWAGSGIGSGGGNAAAIVGGVILGSLIGNAVERDAVRRPGVELTVRLDTGRMIAVVQDDYGDPFRPGDRIRVLSDGFRTRIAR